MMRRLIIVVLMLALLLVAVTPVLAAPGGMPAAHGVDGPTFGAVVAELAESEPLALAEHVAGCWAP